MGGPLPDAGLALSKILATLADEHGRIAIPGIYDKSSAPVGCGKSEPELAAIYDGPVPQPSRYRRVRSDAAGRGDNPWTMIWRTVGVGECRGISSRRDARNIINGTAWARVGMRLVPDMDAHEWSQRWIAHLESGSAVWVQVNVTPLAPKARGLHHRSIRRFPRAAFAASGLWPRPVP